VSKSKNHPAAAKIALSQLMGRFKKASLHIDDSLVTDIIEQAIKIGWRKSHPERQS